MNLIWIDIVIGSMDKHVGQIVRKEAQGLVLRFRYLPEAGRSS